MINEAIDEKVVVDASIVAQMDTQLKPDLNNSMSIIGQSG